MWNWLGITNEPKTKSVDEDQNNEKADSIVEKTSNDTEIENKDDVGTDSASAQEKETVVKEDAGQGTDKKVAEVAANLSSMFSKQ